MQFRDDRGIQGGVKEGVGSPPRIHEPTVKFFEGPSVPKVPNSRKTFPFKPKKEVFLMVFWIYVEEKKADIPMKRKRDPSTQQNRWKKWKFHP